MPDLIFTTGIDDSGFKKGLKQLTQYANGQSTGAGGTSAAGVNVGVGGGASTQAANALGIRGMFAAGAKLGVGFQAATYAIQLFKGGIDRVREDIDKYRDFNGRVARDRMLYSSEQANLSKSIGRGSSAIDKVFGISDTKYVLARAFRKQIDGLVTDLFRLSPGTIRALKAEEKSTRNESIQSLDRSFGSPARENSLRLRGLNGQADLIAAKRDFTNRRLELRKQIDEMIKKGTLTKAQGDDVYLREWGDLLGERNLRISEATRYSTSSSTGDVPVALRAAIQGSPSAPREISPQEQKYWDTQNSRLQDIASKTGSARYGR